MSKKKIDMLDDKTIVEIAEKSGIPPGWYGGPWFDDSGSIRGGVPDCLRDFVKAILTHNALLNGGQSPSN